MKRIEAPFEQRLTRLNPRRMQVVAGGVETSYWVYGDASAAQSAVLIHGFRGDHHGLEYIASELGSEFFTIIPDLPGFGESNDFDGEATIDAYAGWLREFFAQVKRDSHTVLIGHSFGSIVVGAAFANGLVARKCVLINPVSKNALRGPQALLTRLAVFYYWLATALPERAGLALLKNPLVVRVMSVVMAKTKNRKLRAWIHNQHDLYFSSFHTRKAVMQAFKTSVSHTVRDYVDSLPERSLILLADKDDVTDLPAQMEFVSLLNEPRVEIITGVGHLVHYEAAAWAAGCIRNFVSGAGAE